ncbi:MAG: hypothetical protein P0S96_04635 [Simkaniaceae bacterium]|nr:hypothetical protein [Candidatus Sacchlamyda saccharinae]
MAIHPEIRAEANRYFQQEVAVLKDMGISSSESQRILRDINEVNARLLQGEVEGIYDKCVRYLHEELTETRARKIRAGLRQLRPYPTIHSQLEAWVRSLAPKFYIHSAAAG